MHSTGENWPQACQPGRTASPGRDSKPRQGQQGLPPIPHPQHAPPYSTPLATAGVTPLPSAEMPSERTTRQPVASRAPRGATCWPDHAVAAASAACHNQPGTHVATETPLAAKFATTGLLAAQDCCCAGSRSGAASAAVPIAARCAAAAAAATGLQTLSVPVIGATCTISHPLDTLQCRVRCPAPAGTIAPAAWAAVRLAGSSERRRRRRQGPPSIPHCCWLPHAPRKPCCSSGGSGRSLGEGLVGPLAPWCIWWR